jgi:hypothetical protein
LAEAKEMQIKEMLEFSEKEERGREVSGIAKELGIYAPGVSPSDEELEDMWKLFEGNNLTRDQKIAAVKEAAVKSGILDKEGTPTRLTNPAKPKKETDFPW